jgi:cytochrome oxidase Cu insertion factor (SCO1/SenC/PrrC family)
VGRKQLVVIFVLLVAVALAVAVAAASRGDDKAPQTKPAGPAVTSKGLGDDDANVMRRLQRPRLVRAHK